VDEDALTRTIITLASEYGRYGYRRITALLRMAGWQIGKDRVQRLWRREGLKVHANMFGRYIPPVNLNTKMSIPSNLDCAECQP
jgi:transposase InsO family protein